jgi:hypothetical protein
MSNPEVAEVRDLFIIDPNQKVLGDVVTWSTKGIRGVKYADVVQHLQDVGLDPDAAKAVLPRSAFSRAANALKKGKVISRLKQDKATMTFQFTSEKKDHDQFVYDRETALVLDKETGVVSCPEGGHGDLVKKVQELINEAITTRSGGQISKIVQRIFETQADLFSLRDVGGVYFVPARHKEIEDKAARFLLAVSGKRCLRQLPVPMGTVEGNTSVKDAITDGLTKMARDHLGAIESFDVTTRDDTLEKTVTRINETAFKIEAYAEYIGSLDIQGKLLGILEEGREMLKRKRAQIANEKEDKKANPGEQADEDDGGDEEAVASAAPGVTVGGKDDPFGDPF